MSTNELKMPDINTVMIAARLTRDPELKALPGGASVCKLGVAHNKRFKTATGEDREETVFLNVTAWAKQGEWCAEHLKQGYPVIITGRLSQNSWTDKTSGENKTVTEITAHSVQSLTWDGSRGNTSAGGGEHEPIPEDDIPF